jgi:hypothetical protein
MWRPDHSPDWWRCFGAHGLPSGPGRSDFYPKFALAFNCVLDKAFNNPEGYVVNFDKAWDTVPALMKQGPFPTTNLAVVGGDYDNKYWLFSSDPAEEELVFKFVHPVDEDWRKYAPQLLEAGGVRPAQPGTPLLNRACNLLLLNFLLLNLLYHLVGSRVSHDLARLNISMDLLFAK